MAVCKWRCVHVELCTACMLALVGRGFPRAELRDLSTVHVLSTFIQPVSSSNLKKIIVLLKI